MQSESNVGVGTVLLRAVGPFQALRLAPVLGLEGEAEIPAALPAPDLKSVERARVAVLVAMEGVRGLTHGGGLGSLGV